MLAGLNGVLFRGKTERIIAHRMQYIEAAQAFVACENIAGDIAQRMPDVQTRSRGIREHIEDIILRFGGLVVNLECLVGTPPILPLLFNLFEIVLHTVIFFSK